MPPPGPPPPSPEPGGGGLTSALQRYAAEAERFAREWAQKKAANLRAEALGTAIAGSMVGSALPFPYSIPAGIAGVQILPAGSYSLGDYLTAALLVRQTFGVGATPIIQSVGVAGRTLRTVFGGPAIVVTVGGSLFFRYVDPPSDDDGFVHQLLRGLITGGTDEGPLWPDPLGLRQYLPGGGDGGQWQNVFAQMFAITLQLYPYWTRDP